VELEVSIGREGIELASGDRASASPNPKAALLRRYANHYASRFA
jgi:hypothetical protein